MALRPVTDYTAIFSAHMTSGQSPACTLSRPGEAGFNDKKIINKIMYIGSRKKNFN